MLIKFLFIDFFVTFVKINRFLAIHKKIGSDFTHPFLYLFIYVGYSFTVQNHLQLNIKYEGLISTWEIPLDPLGSAQVDM